MRLIFFWVTALAVLSLANAKNSTAKTKPKRQLDNIRSAHNLQYSLVLPHSRVAQFRSLTNNRRVSNGSPRAGKLPPYAVQMEPVVQYSQKDPLYDPNLNNLDDSVVNKNEIHAQPKILNVGESAESFGPPYGSLPTAPLYSQHPHPHYYEAPEPIIEIIIKESNESLPAPPPPPIQKKKKEPVQVFYVKYSKDPHSKDKVVYEKPIPAITPPSNDEEEDHHHDYVTVTPEPLYIPPHTTTLRAIIKPDSEVYHSDSSVKVTFGNQPHHHYSDRRESSNEDHEETAPRPAIAYPNQPNPASVDRSVSPKPQHHEPIPRPHVQLSSQNYRPISQYAQSRIQFQSPYVANEQELPRQGPSIAPFRSQSHISRQSAFGPTPSLSPQHPFSSGPNPPTQFTNNHNINPSPSSPPFSGHLNQAFSGQFQRPNSNPPTFHTRPSSAPPTFAPRPHFGGPPRAGFHTGPQKPFHQPHSPSKPFFDEAKYLQENYHTITTDQIEPSKEQQLPNPNIQNFNFAPHASPSPATPQFPDLTHSSIIPAHQQLPQQRPPLHFTDNVQNKPFLGSSNRPPFFNLKPSPPFVENNRPSFLQHHTQHQQQFSFHQGPQALPRPSNLGQQNLHNQHSFSNQISPSSPAPIPQNQFLPQPSSPTLFNFHQQPSPSPEQSHHFHQQPERPLYSQHRPGERPIPNQQQNFLDQSNIQHQQNVGQFIPKESELVAAIPKYEQHITVNGPNSRPNYNGFSASASPSPSPPFSPSNSFSPSPSFPPSPSPSPSPSNPEPNYHQIQQQQQHQQQLEQQHQQQQLQQQQQQQRQQQLEQQYQQQQLQQQQQQHQQQLEAQHQQLKEQQQREQQHQQLKQQQQREQQHQQREQQHQQQQVQQQQLYDNEQEQVRLQLAQNVQKQQEEIQRLQTQLLIAQHHQKQQHQSSQLQNEYTQLRNHNQQQIQASTPRSQYAQQTHERSRQQIYASSPSPPYYQSTSRTVEITPTTQKYVSSTLNSISVSQEKEEKKKKPSIELPDEVPDDLRQQLLSSGILDNADISVLDYDKVGDTPLDSLPPDQLANFFSAGGAQQIAASERRPIVVKPNGESIESRIDEDLEDDQEIAASENVGMYVAPPTTTSKHAVEMKVVHFDPKTEEGKNIAQEYVKEDASQVDPVTLNDKKYNRYLPLKVSGNQFPLPDILKGRKVTSVVVLAPVQTEAISHSRTERAAANTLKGIKFVAGDSLQDLLKKPTKDNFEKWLEVEKRTSSDMQSVILLVTGTDEPTEEREIFMYDAASGKINKLSGELSNAFVEAAENNSLSKDIENLAIEGEGTPENFNKDEEDAVAEASENVPLFVELPIEDLHQGDSNQVSISSGYSKTKHGRSLRRHR